MLSYCTYTSYKYITPSSPFLLHMYFSGIYYSIKSFPTAHVYPINILQHQVLSDCACTSHEYITSSSAFRLHMYIPEIYYSNKCFPTAHVHPWNILQHQQLSDCTCTPQEYKVFPPISLSQTILQTIFYSWIYNERLQAPFPDTNRS